jgi:CRISPR/Cas system CSM-associated protein Csm2 small subunit
MAMTDNLKRAEESAEKVGRAYKALTVTLAVTTSVVVPAIELMIIFLPEILKWINKNNARDKLSERFQNDVFPGIKAELRKSLPPILEGQMRNLLEGINRSFEEQITRQKDIVSSYRKKSDEVFSDVNARKAQVEAILSEVKSLASRYLYA